MSYKNRNKSLESKKAVGRSWVNYLPIVFLITLMGNGLIIFCQVSKTVHDNAKVDPQVVPTLIGGREYDNKELSDDDFRSMARQLDQDVLDAYRNSRLAQQKQARRERFVDYGQDPEIYIEDRIQGMKDELERNFSGNAIAEQGTIAFELQKSINELESKDR